MRDLCSDFTRTVGSKVPSIAVGCSCSAPGSSCWIFWAISHLFSNPVRAFESNRGRLRSTSLREVFERMWWQSSLLSELNFFFFRYGFEASGSCRVEG